MDEETSQCCTTTVANGLPLAVLDASPRGAAHGFWKPPAHRLLGAPHRRSACTRENRPVDSRPDGPMDSGSVGLPDNTLNRLRDDWAEAFGRDPGTVPRIVPGTPRGIPSGSRLKTQPDSNVYGLQQDT
jgi:hypothetical protein